VVGPPPHTVLNIGEAPRLGQPLSIERPEKGGREEQESLVDRPGNGKEADPGEPAEGARDSPVAGEEPDGADCALCASHRGKTTRRLAPNPPQEHLTRPLEPAAMDEFSERRCGGLRSPTA